MTDHSSALVVAGVGASPVALPTAAAIYVPSEGGALRQTEILSRVIQHVPVWDEHNEVYVRPDVHDFAIVISQDCDLAQDYDERTNPKGKPELLIPTILFCSMMDATKMLAQVDPRLSAKKAEEGTRWKTYIQKNKDERYQFLEAVPPANDRLGVGIPEQGCDFKRYFTIPTDEFYRQLELNIIRRCVLVHPYLEHFTSRFAAYLSRVALPNQHESE